MARGSEINQLTGRIIDTAVRLHAALGPGLLETVYESILARDLSRAGLRLERQKPFSFEYDGLHFERAFRPDLVVEDCVIVEVKSLPAILPMHEKQLLTYLRLLDLRVGLILNFGAPLLKQGIRRMVNNL